MKYPGHQSSIAAVLDRTHWDFSPGQDRSFLLDPVGQFFGELPWEAQPQYLGPVTSLPDLDDRVETLKNRRDLGSLGVRKLGG
ncbi:MAG: hypothetical protein ACC742_08555 [Thermoanaerobaculales bacterium]